MAYYRHETKTIVEAHNTRDCEAITAAAAIFGSLSVEAVEDPAKSETFWALCLGGGGDSR